MPKLSFCESISNLYGEKEYLKMIHLQCFLREVNHNWACLSVQIWRMVLRTVLKCNQEVEHSGLSGPS